MPQFPHLPAGQPWRVPDDPLLSSLSASSLQPRPTPFALPCQKASKRPTREDKTNRKGKEKKKKEEVIKGKLELALGQIKTDHRENEVWEQLSSHSCRCAILWTASRKRKTRRAVGAKIKPSGSVNTTPRSDTEPWQWCSGKATPCRGPLQMSTELRCGAKQWLRCTHR